MAVETFDFDLATELADDYFVANSAGVSVKEAGYFVDTDYVAAGFFVVAAVALTENWERMTKTSCLGFRYFGC